MATRDVPSHPVEAEEQRESKGLLGKVKASARQHPLACRGSAAGRSP